MVKTCFYASELVQGCSKVIILRNGMTGSQARNELISLIFEVGIEIFGTPYFVPYLLDFLSLEMFPIDEQSDIIKPTQPQIYIT